MDFLSFLFLGEKIREGNCNVAKSSFYSLTVWVFGGVVFFITSQYTWRTGVGGKETVGGFAAFVPCFGCWAGFSMVWDRKKTWNTYLIPPLNGWEEEQERPHTADSHMSVSVKLGLALMLSAEYYRCYVRLERFIYLGENEHPSTTV